MIDASPLTSRYKTLQQADANDYGETEQLSFRDIELDRLYLQLVSLPIVTLADAIDKLAFADHCLTEEYDSKEASNLIREVAAALLILHRATIHSPSIFVANDRSGAGDKEQDGQEGTTE